MKQQLSNFVHEFCEHVDQELKANYYCENNQRIVVFEIIRSEKCNQKTNKSSERIGHAQANFKSVNEITGSINPQNSCGND